MLVQRVADRSRIMHTPTQPVSFTPEQVHELSQRLATLRHDINNHLSLIMAATELIRHKPQMAERMMVTLCEQPPKITNAIAAFSREFESAFGLKHA